MSENTVCHGPWDVFTALVTTVPGCVMHTYPIREKQAESMAQSSNDKETLWNSLQNKWKQDTVLTQQYKVQVQNLSIKVQETDSEVRRLKKQVADLILDQKKSREARKSAEIEAANLKRVSRFVQNPKQGRILVLLLNCSSSRL
jgi:predicted RNase H-like nuclease (RuvC/YqgF family)